MYRRQPMLPIDGKFGVRTPDIFASNSNGYIQKLQKKLDWAYKTAHEVSKKESEHSKRRYDWNVKCTELEPGNLILVRQKVFKEKHKISNRRENIPDHVIQCIGAHLPVYKVQLVDDSTKVRILHRNLLFPLAMRNESDEKQQVMEISKPKLACSDKENNTPSEQINYEGQVTRGKAKGIKIHCCSKLTC